MIYLVEDGDKYSVEMPEYTVTQLWSDIGGAAGLMLGISFATLIGVVDCLFSFLFVLIRGRQWCHHKMVYPFNRHFETRGLKSDLNCRSHHVRLQREPNPPHASHSATRQPTSRQLNLRLQNSSPPRQLASRLGVGILRKNLSKTICYRQLPS